MPAMRKDLRVLGQDELVERLEDDMSESSEKAQLYLAIDDKYYLVERVFPEGEKTACKGWKLIPFEDKYSVKSYSVIRQPSGRLTCQCGDFEFVKQKVGGTCKHIDALKQIGLIK